MGNPVRLEHVFLYVYLSNHNTTLSAKWTMLASLILTEYASTQPLWSSRIRHLVILKAEVNQFELRVFLLLDWLTYWLKRPTLLFSHYSRRDG